MAHFPSLPLLLLCFPLYPFSTYLAPSSCDRNRPPPSQVACKLTLFAPPLYPIVPPFPTSQNPNCPAPNNDDLGTIPLLLCGTRTYALIINWTYEMLNLTVTVLGSAILSWEGEWGQGFTCLVTVFASGRARSWRSSWAGVETLGWSCLGGVIMSWEGERGLGLTQVHASVVSLTLVKFSLTLKVSLTSVVDIVDTSV